MEYSKVFSDLGKEKERKKKGGGKSFLLLFIFPIRA